MTDICARKRGRLMRVAVFTLALAVVHASETRAWTADASDAIAKATAALQAKRPAEALPWIDRVLERDAGSVAAWDLRARWATATDSRDELAFSLHSAYRLAVAQQASKADLTARRAALEAADPVAKDLLEYATKFLAIYLFTSSKQGISASVLARQIGVAVAPEAARRARRALHAVA